MNNRSSAGFSMNDANRRLTPSTRLLGRIAWWVSLAISLLLGTPDASASCAGPPSGLVSWWRAEGNVLDAVSGNHGSLLNGATNTAGQVGSAFSFDGVNDLAMIPRAASLDMGNQATIEFWMKADPSNAMNSYQGLVTSDFYGIEIANGYALGPLGVSFFLSTDGGATDSASSYPATATANGGGAIITAGQWHHVAGTYDGTKLQLYIDGQPWGVPDFHTGAISPMRSDSFVTIGAEDGRTVCPVCVGNRYFKGLIDEPAIYNRGLSANEIAAIYAAGSAGKCVVSNPPPPVCAPAPSGLVDWWRGEGNANDSVGDANGALRDGTAFASGKAGQAFTFDGVNDSVSFGNTAGNFGTNDFAVEFWLRSTATTYESVIEKWPLCGLSSMWAIRIRGPGPWGAAGRVEAFMISDTAGNDVNSIFSERLVNDGVFHHVAMVRQATNLTLYIDGSFEAKGSTPAVTRINNPTDLVAGRSVCTDVDGTRNLAGQLDEISIYNRALTTAEIQSIYNAGSVGKCASTSPPCLPAPAGLAGWWRAEGNTADSAGGNPGVLVGNTTYGMGRVEQSFVFDGDADAVNLGNPASLQLQNFTIEAWIKRADPTRATQDPANINGCILSYGHNGYGFTLLDDGRLDITQVDIGGVFSSALRITDTNFHHVALTKSGAAIVFYIDGVGETSAPYDPGFTFTTPATIGARGDNLTSGFWGLIDEFAVFNRALSATEIQSIFVAGSAGKCAATNPPPPCAPAPSGLVSWWPGQGNASDRIGANPGTLQNGVGFVSGEVDSAFNFDAGASVRLGAAPSLTMSNSFSVELWLYPTGPGGAPGYGGILINKEGQYEIARFADGTIQWAVATPGNPVWNWVNSGYAAPAEQWTHLAWTYDFGTSRLYANGQLVQTYPGSGPVGSLAVYSPNEFWIGNRQDVAASQWFQGRLDEISIYNRALSATDIQSIYNAGSAGKCVISNPPPSCVTAPADLVSWWRAEGDASDPVSGLNGTLAGGAGFAAGKVGQAFSFDGANAYVQIGDRPGLVMSNALTVEAWIFPTGAGSGPVGEGIIINKEGEYEMDRLPGGTIRWAIASSSPVWLWTETPLVAPLNSWTHVALVYDHGVTKIYGNGSLVQSNNGPTDLGDIYPTLNDFQIGGRQAISENFNGLIDEVAVFKRALSASEIAAIYAAGSAGKCVVSNPPPPPVIVSQPTNLTVYVGSNATFRVTATGAEPLRYQWRLNGNNLPGKTSGVLSLTSVQFSNAGPYSVVVSNAGGSAISSNAVLTVNPLPICVPPPAGLVSWWRAENDSTDNWDSNNGTVNGRGFTAGKVGRAFLFPAISVPDAPSLRVTNGLTIEAWVNPSSLPGTEGGTILSKSDASSVLNSTNNSYVLGIANNGRPLLAVWPHGSRIAIAGITAGQALPINQWSFVVATYDGAALRLYVNGTLASQTNYSAGIFPGNATLGIGGQPYLGQFVQTFVGALDEVSLYNRALTDAEILAIYNADVVGKCLVAPTIVTQPQDQAVPLGEDVKFSVSVAGNRPLKFQWQFLSSTTSHDFQPIVGATNAALVLEKVKVNQSRVYRVAVTNAVGFAISAPAELTLLPAPACTDSPASLISWWPADGNQFDAMGANNIDGFTPTLYVTGKVDRAFSLNGISSRIGVNNSASVNFGSNADFSIEMWIKAGTSNTVFPNVPLFEKKDGTTAWVGYSLSLNQGRLAFAMGSSPLSATNVSAFVSPGPDLRDAMFHHVAVSVNRTATNGGNLYVDGQLVLNFNPTPRKGSLVAGTPLFLGAPWSTTSNSYFGGLIDEPALYNRALTATEILAIRQAGAAGKCKVKPSILVQPVGQRVTVGSNVTFSVVAAGTPRLRYQWFMVGGKDIFGATNAAYTITNIFARAHAGLYSVRVTNLFGSVVSSNALLTVNNVPTALPQTVSLNEDTPTPITLIGSDPDLDPLSYPIVTPPAHGALSGTGSNVVYTPNPNYNGPDSFTFKVNDGLVDSAPATVNLTILPVNDPPVAQSQSVALDEDTTAAITLGAFDVDGDPLTFTVGTPAHGTLTGTPPNLSYRPATNYFGPDSFTFSVSDGLLNSEIATVSLTVRPVNDPPVAKIVVSPLVELPGITNRVMIAPVCANAAVVLDGSESSDVEHDPLEFIWSEGTNVFATAVTITNEFEPGTHELALLVSDGTATTRETDTVEVVTPSEAVAALILFIAEAHIDRHDLKSLVHPLQEAMKDMDHCHAKSASKQLREFQKKLEKIEKRHPALAAQLLAAAQTILDAVDDEKRPRRHEPPRAVTSE